MRELSIEEKAKAYDKALKAANNELKCCGTFDCDAARQIFRLFPELEESEDERMSRELIAYFKNNSVYIKWSGLDVKKVIEWLEKQGQTFTKKDVDDAYLKGVCDAKHELKKQGEQDNWAEELNNRIKALHKQFLEIIQEYITPCWEKMSAEDEKMYKKVETAINSYYAPFSRDAEEMSEWLKSLKDRVQTTSKYTLPQREEGEPLIYYFEGCIAEISPLLRELFFEVVKEIKAKQWKQSGEQIKAIIESLRHKWSMGDSAEAKYKVEAYDELIELLKGE